MPLSNIQRVVYKKNPLIQVVCQLRFPRILMINERPPADFQEKIRDNYPLFENTVEQQQIALDINGGVPPTPRILQSEAVNNYKFSSSDEKWQINLTSTFLALSTSSYDRWENFNEHLKKPLDTLLEIYRPSFFERVGLRYINAFKKSPLNLNDIAWTELIKPFVLGFMSNPDISGKVRTQRAFVELDMENGAIAQINAGKGLTDDANQGFPFTDSEEAFIVDSDMYMLRKRIDELDTSLAYLHDCSAKLVKSSITDKLHNAMEPMEL